MPIPRRSLSILIAAACLGVAPAASAVTIEWVTVGSPGNACEPHALGCAGSVDHPYRIAKYEVTNAQYAEFLNAKAASDPLGLYNPLMETGGGGIARAGNPGSFTYALVAGREDMPICFVSYFDALRFANWLHNGQGNGDTETGAYTLLGGTPTPTDTFVARNAGATVFIPSEDEWYKAAYYDHATATYFDYPTRTNTPTVCAAPGGTPNTANCGFVAGDFTPAGSYTGSPGPSGTFDQGGNATEWDEVIVFLDHRGQRGGWVGSPVSRLAATAREYDDPREEIGPVGFRVASQIVDAPACSDGLDNDGDGRADFDPETFLNPGDQNTPPAGTGDPVCTSPDDASESSPCQDGIDNDSDRRPDYDAGLSVNGVADPDGPDPRCTDPWTTTEAPACGLGVELLVVLPPLRWLARRKRKAGQGPEGPHPASTHPRI